MKLEEIYALFVKEGIKTDLRTSSQIKTFLTLKQKEFRQLKASSRKFFDKESLVNPFSDTRILYGHPEKSIKRILVGIDIEIGEMLLADRLCQRGTHVDLVLAHHPEGVALAGLDDVMHLQTDVLKNLGFEEKVAKDLMKGRIDEVGRKLHSNNHTRTVDAAELLDIPLMCCHTPSDNHVVEFLQKLIAQKKPKTLQNLVDLLLTIPEYQDAAVNKAGPKIWIGKPSDKLGHVLVDMTGGTEGSKEIFARLSQLGIQTQLSMHLSEIHYEKIKLEHIHVVIAGHMASDNLGMNLLLDKLEKKAEIDIIPCSGFRRVRR